MLFAAATTASAEPDPRCASTDLNELLACATETHERADRELNRQWDRMHRTDALVGAQRAWIAWRDLECTAQNAALEGREGPIWREACLAAVTEQRTQQLRESYRWLQTSDAEISVEEGEAASSCKSDGSTGVEYRNCLYEQSERSRRRVETALARNRQEAVEKDAAWQEHRRNSDVAPVADPTVLEALNRSQAAWEEYAEFQCTLEGYTALGGTARGDYELRCRDRLNLERLEELRSPFTLESQRLEPVPDE